MIIIVIICILLLWIGKVKAIVNIANSVAYVIVRFVCTYCLFIVFSSASLNYVVIKHNNNSNKKKK